MKTRITWILAALGAATLLTGGVALGEGPGAAAREAMTGEACEPFADFVAPADSLPHLRYRADGQVTLNDRCPVRQVKLNPKMGASYVNGRPVGFC